MKFRCLTIAYLAIAAICAATIGLASQGFAASGYGARGTQPEQQNLGMQIYNQQAPDADWQAGPQGAPQLSPEQYGLARRLYDNAGREMAEIRQELAAKTGMLDEELDQMNPDRAKIERLSAEIGQLRGRLLAKGADLRANLVSNGLPPDCLGPCYSYDGYWHGMMGGCWSGYDGYGRGQWGGHRHGGWHGGMMGRW